MTHKIVLTDEQSYKLKQASDLISDAMHTGSLSAHVSVDPKILSTWLSVAGNYCHEIAREVVEAP